MKIKDLKKGDFFTKKAIDFPNENQVWIRCGYDYSEKKYECVNFADSNKYCYLDGKKEVFTDFTF